MKQNTTAIISVHDLDSAGTAGQIFRRVRNRDPRARAIIKANPERALAALNQGDASLGLTPKGSADTLESIVEEVGDDKRMQELLGQHLTSERVRELLAARGDLDAALATIAPLQDVLAAITQDLASLTPKEVCESEARIGLVLRGWAYKLRERPDYDELLQEEVAGQPLAHWIVFAVWITLVTRSAPDNEEISEGIETSYDAIKEAAWRRGEDNSEDEREAKLRLFQQEGASYLDELNIDPDNGVLLFQNLLDEGLLEELDLNELMNVRRAIAARREELEGAPTELEAAIDEATGIAEELDI